MRPDLSGKVAIVTGAGRLRGIGATIARELALAGARVVVHDRKPGSDDPPFPADEGLDGVVRSITEAGGTCAGFTADLTQETQVAELVDFAVSHFGGLDILINNAGIGYLVGPIQDFAADDWDRVMAVNLRGAFLGIKHAAQVMQAAGRGGRIISIGSQASKSGVSLMSAYAASKHGLIGLTRSAALELGRHAITVNAVCPNHVPTDLGNWQRENLAAARGWDMAEYWNRFRARVPLGEPGRPEDTAAACLFLASDAARYITGEAMNVSGGEEYH